MVLYESLDGKRIMGIPFELFKYVFNQKDFKNFIHVWVVESFKIITKELKSNENIIFVKRGTDAYFKYISSAKYLICNNTYSDYVVRKPSELYFQTSHGIFYKPVGRDSFGTPLGWEELRETCFNQPISSHLMNLWLRNSRKVIQ